MTSISLNLSLLSPEQAALARDNGVPQNPDFLGKSGFSFQSMLDVVNPLQQLPIVSTIYRAATGDSISSGAQLAGGALYGGPLGFASALFNEIVKTTTGKNIGDSMLAMITGSDATQVVQNDPALYAPPPTNQAAYAAYKHTQSLLA